MQTYLEGLEPVARKPANRRAGAVIEGWKVSAVCEELVECPVMDAPAKSREYWRLVEAHPAYSPDQECFVVFCLNVRCRLIGWQLVTLGTATSCLVHPREVFRAAIIAGAHSVVCAHNHPAGDPSPSSADFQITRQLVSAARTVGIGLIDHVVIGRPDRDPNGKGYYSFREAGLV